MNNPEKKALHDIYEKKSGIPGLLNFLGSSRMSHIAPILIEAMKERCKKISPTELLESYDSQKDFFHPSTIKQRETLGLMNLFYNVLSKDYDSVDISPISPLGLNSIITKISQNNILSTVKGSEVVSDSTTPLIIECASRRKKLARSENTLLEPVKIATCLRVLRMQKFDVTKRFTQHFKLIGLASVGREADTDTFITSNVIEHITIWLEFIDILQKNQYDLNNISVNISSILLLERIISDYKIPRDIVTRNSLKEEFNLFKAYNINLPEKIDSLEFLESKDGNQYLPIVMNIETKFLSSLRKKFPKVNFFVDLNRKAGLGYYLDICYHIFATTKNGVIVQLADGGSVDWASKLLSDNKELAVTSGFGAELVYKHFRS